MTSLVYNAKFNKNSKVDIVRYKATKRIECIKMAVVVKPCGMDRNDRMVV